jgi:hypothetical protein
MASSILSQAQLKELLHYNPETGVFRWRKSPRYRIQPWDLAGHIKKFSDCLSYLIIGIGGTTYSAHRLAWVYMTGEISSSKVIDHIDGNGLNNSWHNLRMATQKQNLENRKQHIKNRSGYRGVSFHKQRLKWQAYVNHNGKRSYLGLFDTPESAAEAARAKREELFTHDHGRAA